MFTLLFVHLYYSHPYTKHIYMNLFVFCVSFQHDTFLYHIFSHAQRYFILLLLVLLAQCISYVSVFLFISSFLFFIHTIYWILLFGIISALICIYDITAHHCHRPFPDKMLFLIKNEIPFYCKLNEKWS